MGLFFFLYFTDFFNSTMWSELRTVVSQGSGVLLSLASSLWLAEQPVLSSSIYLPTTDESLGLKIMACQLFLLLRFTLLHLMTEAKTASPLGLAVQSISWFYQLGGETSPAEHPLGKSVLAGA